MPPLHLINSESAVAGEARPTTNAPAQMSPSDLQ